MSDAEAAELWHHMPNSPFRKLIEFELEMRVIAEKAKLETDLTFEEYKKQQGVLEGLRIAIGILNRKDNPNKRS